MKLLKTALLSTSLLMSGLFGADASGADAASPARLDEIAQTKKAFEAYKTQNGLIILSFLKSKAKLDLASLGLSKSSTYQAIVEKLGDVLNDLAAIKRAQATTAESLVAVKEANKRLTAEKVEAEQALAAANEKLAAVTAEREVVAGQLRTAEVAVAEKTEALTAVKAASEETDRATRDAIAKLTGELATEKGRVTTLTAQKTELEALIAKTEADVVALRAKRSKLTQEVISVIEAETSALAALAPPLSDDD